MRSFSKYTVFIYCTVLSLSIYSLYVNIQSVYIRALMLFKYTIFIKIYSFYQNGSLLDILESDDVDVGT